MPSTSRASPSRVRFSEASTRRLAGSPERFLAGCWFERKLNGAKRQKYDGRTLGGAWSATAVQGPTLTFELAV